LFSKPLLFYEVMLFPITSDPIGAAKCLAKEKWYFGAQQSRYSRIELEKEALDSLGHPPQDEGMTEF